MAMLDGYLRLLAELDRGLYDSPTVLDALAQVGPTGLALRGLARARRHAWTSAQADLRSALVEGGPEQGGLDPGRMAYVAGTGLVVARDYHAGLAALGRAATSPEPAVAGYSAKLAAKLARELGWVEEAAAWLDRVAETSPANDLQQRTQQLQRRSASQRRAAEALLGPHQVAAGKAWARVFTDGIDAAEASVASLIERRGEQPELLAVAARLALLRGDRETAARHLGHDAPAALAEQVALALAEGDHGRALVLAGERETPRLLHLRGEALLDAGEFAEAAAVLERARTAAPWSVPIALALTLARYREQPDAVTTEFEHRFAGLLADAPALLADAAAITDLELWTDMGSVTDRSTCAAILTQGRALLTDERSTDHAHYHRPGAPLRQVLPPHPAHARRPTHLERLHADDERWIDRVHSTVLAKLGIQPDKAPEPPRPRAAAGGGQSRGPSSLSPEQVERFLHDGYLKIPRAFDPELARRWREDANRRIREEPERWVRGYDPAEPGKSLRGYSPDDPSSWTWSRVVLEGNEDVPVAEFAPTAWAAICDLLGGPERIATRIWSNYLILNLCDGADLESDRPSPDGVGWHIDDPHPAMRLDQIRNGLVCITVVDELRPASGNTWLSPDSVGRVARALAEHPEGVDFVHQRGAWITRECERFEEVVGETGDVFLLHPLLMHSSSPNRSGRIRWIGNPMVYMRQPLDPLRADRRELSPVELAIRRAID